MENQIGISVIIPMYNSEATIQRVISSVLIQTYNNLEVIIVDDASSDCSADIINSIKDSRIKYIKNQKNMGPAASRNIGVKQARYDYIAFEDSDDEWLPDKLKMQMELMNSDKELGLVYCAYTYTTEKSQIKVPPNCYKKEELEGYIFESIWKENKIGTPTILMKKECFNNVGGFNSSLKSIEDWEFVLRVAQKYKIGYLNQAMVNADYTREGVNNRYDAQIDAYICMMKEFPNMPREDKILTIFNLLWKIPLYQHKKYMSMLCNCKIVNSQECNMLYKIFGKYYEERIINQTYSRIVNFDILKSFLIEQSNISAYEQEKPKVAVYGASSLGKVVYTQLKQCGFNVVGIIDRNDIQIKGMDVINVNDYKNQADIIIFTIRSLILDMDMNMNQILPDAKAIKINLFDIIKKE